MSPALAQCHGSISDLKHAGGDAGTMSSPRRQELVFVFVFSVHRVWCFLGFGEDVTTAASVFFASLYSELKTHCLRTTVSFLLRVTS